jgi:hypothetical protein
MPKLTKYGEMKQTKIIMNKIRKMFSGVFIALLLATSMFAYDIRATDVPSTNKITAVESVKAPAESWTLTLGGAGMTMLKGKSDSAVGLDVSIGRTGHLLLPVEAGVRQSFAYATPGDGTVLFNTKLYSDWTLLTVKRFDLFAGGNIGMAYGNIPLMFSAAPEAGLRCWIKKDVAIVGRVEYPFDLNNGCSRDALNYFLGVQVKF